MSEFRIHHDVNELLSLLRVHGGDGAEVYIDLLQKNRTPYVTTTVSAHSAKVGARPPWCALHRVPLPGRRPGSARGGVRRCLPAAVRGLCVPLSTVALAPHGRSGPSALCGEWMGLGDSGCRPDLRA